MHDHLGTLIVAPTTTKSRRAPFRILVAHAGRRGLVWLDQLGAVDKLRLVQQLGSVSAKTLSDTLSTLREVFAE